MLPFFINFQLTRISTFLIDFKYNMTEVCQKVFSMILQSSFSVLYLLSKRIVDIRINIHNLKKKKKKVPKYAYKK